MGAPPYLADFDSASGMLRATSNALRGERFEAIGQSRAMKPFARAANLLPRPARETVFALGGAMEAIPARKLGTVRAEALSGWAAGRYPERRYQAVALGSSNGALTHLCAAFDMPWLPQTFFVPVRRLGGDPDDPKAALEFCREHAGPLLEANPDLQVHNMHDANQDRLMVTHLEYFRVKRRRLGAAYARFLDRNLAPGGTILLVECGQSYPTTRLGPRQVFQHGAVGGATPEEFHLGGPRVAEYLERYGSERRSWDSPPPDGESPEAEWGFEPALRDDVLDFARDRGFRVRRLVFDAPMDLSPLVADFYRQWNRRRGIRANRLLVESFILHEPRWTFRIGATPFWMVFNMEPSADALEAFLDEREPFDEIELMLFNHGVEAVGFATVERWRSILGRARRQGRFLGVRPDLHPRDFGSFARYHDALRAIPARYPTPGPLPLDEFVAFVERADGRYAAQLLDA